ncbi:MAG: rhomboid family intramembrane serine protease [Pseudanabaenaceae cyanobacterium]
MLFPLHDDNPTRSTAIVVYGLIAVNVVVFFYQISLPNLQLMRLLNQWAVIPSQLNNNLAQEWFTILTYQFLHGSLWHLISNMWFLYLFGNNVEDQLGSFKFLAFYLLCGAGAAAAQVVFSSDSVVPMIGASGSIAGVMGAYLVKFPRSRILSILFLGFFFTFIHVPAAVYLGVWIAFQTIEAVMADPNAPGVAYLAHIGGFVVGLLLWQFMPKRYLPDDQPPDDPFNDYE